MCGSGVLVGVLVDDRRAVSRLIGFATLGCGALSPRAVAIGGARRDEERARAKERIFSFRDEFGQWNPRAQRPELWNVYNARVRKGEHVRVFPISNWTELDVWQYVAREQLELPPIYFAHEREVFKRDGMRSE